jgi:hypothetical protein
MRSSFQRRVVIAVGASLAAGFLVSGYVLNKFWHYEDDVAKMMSGEQKTLLLGHVVEARVKAAEELATASVSSEQANVAFREKLQDVANGPTSTSKTPRRRWRP